MATKTYFAPDIAEKQKVRARHAEYPFSKLVKRPTGLSSTPPLPIETSLEEEAKTTKALQIMEVIGDKPNARPFYPAVYLPKLFTEGQHHQFVKSSGASIAKLIDNTRFGCPHPFKIYLNNGRVCSTLF